jgi:hypothetical protein
MLLFAAALLGYGSVSYHWFEESESRMTSHQGLLASEVCGVDLGDDQLENFARAQAGHVEPAEWRCEHDLVVVLVTKLRDAVDVAEWSALMIGLIAGLATAVMALIAGIRAFENRRPSRRTASLIATMPIVGIACPLILSRIGELAGARLDYAAGVYAAGAVLAVISAIRIWPRDAAR